SLRQRENAGKSSVYTLSVVVSISQQLSFGPLAADNCAQKCAHCAQAVPPTTQRGIPMDLIHEQREIEARMADRGMERYFRLAQDARERGEETRSKGVQTAME